MSDKNQPAFPHTVVDSSTNFDLDLIYSGMTLRQYAAIKLKVPDSGTDWLDDMINKSLLDDFAAKAMQGLMNTEYRLTDASYKAKQSYAIADAMLAAREHLGNGSDIIKYRVVAQADPDGWIEWKGGECPVPMNVVVEVVLRNGIKAIHPSQRSLYWGHFDVEYEFDIIKYRVVK